MLSPDLYRSAYPGPEGAISEKLTPGPGGACVGRRLGGGRRRGRAITSMTRKATAGSMQRNWAIDSTRALESRAAGAVARAERSRCRGKLRRIARRDVEVVRVVL